MVHRMAKVEIHKDAFEEWSKNKLIEYSSVSVQDKRVESRYNRLIFGVFVGGGYLVTLGDKVLYEGGSFSTAQGHFHSAQL